MLLLPPTSERSWSADWVLMRAVDDLLKSDSDDEALLEAPAPTSVTFTANIRVCWAALTVRTQGRG